MVCKIIELMSVVDRCKRFKAGCTGGKSLPQSLKANGPFPYSDRDSDSTVQAMGANACLWGSLSSFPLSISDSDVAN